MKYDILGNYNNEINRDYINNIIVPSLVEIDFNRDNDDIFASYGIKNKKIYLEKETASAWISLRDCVRKKGIMFDICFGFLSIDQQTNKYNDFLKRNGLELTINRIAVPGYSEHHTGLALDCDFFKDGDWAGISPDEKGKENVETEIIHDLLANFGFILRYPKGKTKITNTKYEPWHIRYVGVKLAFELKENNLTLEEYQHIKRNKIENNK